ncbi:MAG TPA: hydrogenase maturation nickel metallochaperone HypA [Anaerolineae bacterium]|nr:hydrogenase maturation nickel metallochaperone HypA [Anaerolineae bacterium]
MEQSGTVFGQTLLTSRREVVQCRQRPDGWRTPDVMHELPVTQSLLEIALRHAEEAGARRIVQLNVVIGELASIVDDSVQFYWDIISRGTIAEGAQLHFERMPGLLRCVACGHTFPLNGRDYDCPACGGSQVLPVGGDEFRLESIEVEM